MAETARVISSSLILPFDTTQYSDQLVKEFVKFKHEFKPKLEKVNISLDLIEESINNFKKSSELFSNRLSTIDKSQYYLFFY